MLRSFLIEWHSGARWYIKAIIDGNNEALVDWQEYQQKMESGEEQGSVFPKLRYKRCVLPDCSLVLSSSLRYLSTDAYGSLFYLNCRLKLIDERNSRFEDFFMTSFKIDLTTETRAEAAKGIIAGLKNNIYTATEAQKYAEDDKLHTWLNKQ